MEMYKLVLSVWIYSFALMHSYCQTATLTPAVAGVIEGSEVTLVCKVSPAVLYTSWSLSSVLGKARMISGTAGCSALGFVENETEKYSYTCNSTVYQLTIHSVQRSQHNDVCICIAQGQSEGPDSVIKVTVPITSVTITPHTSTVDIEEHNSKQFTCVTSEGHPAATVSWYKIESGVRFEINQNTTETQNTHANGFLVTTSVLRFVPRRTQNGTKIYCEASNTDNSNKLKSSEKQLNVLYKAVGPTIAEGSEYRFLENVQGRLHCEIEGGNPTPSLKWNCNNNWSSSKSHDDGTITEKLSWTTAQGQDRMCTCTSRQSPFPNKTVSINVIILYPPSTPTFKVDGNTINEPIRFIEGKTRSMQCVTDSKPPPQSYTWTKAQSTATNGQYRTFGNVQRSNAGQYSCEVQNTMNPSRGGPIIGNNTSSVLLQVLYPPKLGILSDMDIEEGNALNKSCPFTPGNPPNTVTRWTRNIDDRTWNKKELNIQSVSQSDDANYTCEIYNVMEPTAAPAVSTDVKKTGTFHLNVQYKAVVTSLYVLGFKKNDNVTTVNETYPLQFNCTVKSNPLPTIQIWKGDNMLNESTGNMILLYSGGKASCLHAGTYTCLGRNKINKGGESSKKLQVNVNCSPRSADKINLNRTSEENNTFTFTFNAIAYPVPVFIWKKLASDEWKDMQNGDNVRITSSGLQSNLTIHRVGQGDFGNYLLVVTNHFGEMEFHYRLEPDDQPCPPADFRLVEHLTTESSIKLEWKPGFNGGPPQTFYIRYKKSSSSTWNAVSVIDTGEQTMRYMLTGLESDTQYQVIIYSSNRKGNSSESEPLIEKTKGRAESSSAPLIGRVIGGIVICLVIVVVTVLIVRHIYARKGKANTAAGKPTRNHYETNSSSDDVGYCNIGSVPDYEALNRQHMDSTTYSSLQPNNSRLTNGNTDGEFRTYENLQLRVIQT